MPLGKRLAWFSTLMLVVLTGCVSTRENRLPSSSASARWYRLRVAPYLQYTAFTEYSYAEQRSAARRAARERETGRPEEGEKGDTCAMKTANANPIVTAWPLPLPGERADDRYHKAYGCGNCNYFFDLRILKGHFAPENPECPRCECRINRAVEGAHRP